MKKVLTVLAVFIVVVVIGAGAVQFLRTSDDTGLNIGQEPEGQQPGEPAEPAQPDWCPRVEFISAPGTWESKADDDPLNPTANERSFMLSISNPLKAEYTPDDVKVWTLPYTAQFKNINSQNEMSYDSSRQEGYSKLEGELRYMHETCPNTKFVMAGFSQGAVILGDMADAIGTGNGPIPAEAVAGVTLIADGRRVNGVGINPGTELSGIGAEVALEPLSGLVQPIVPGATMRGPRGGNFGALADRTYTICAPNDSICDAPQNIGNGLDRALALIDANGVHALYAYNKKVIPGTTANAWTTQWARDVINGI